MEPEKPITAADRLIVALDVPTVGEAFALMHKLMPVVNTFKLGYWLMFDPGAFQLARECRMRNKKFFLDAKLNDIPETVKQGVASAAKCGADFITVHSDETMLHAAMEGKGNSTIKVMAVTALTSMPFAASRDHFRAGVINAMLTGCDGLIMSPADLRDAIGAIAPDWSMRSLVGKMLIATPGVRLPGKPLHDHGRSGTPDAAIQNGADYIIVGRPIIQADDPLAEAERFITHLADHSTDRVHPSRTARAGE
jgi:orotidine-5'-phosphate decarboxylase